ncbi:PorV/PorQ family protein [Pseudochryseolinea flava]|uniref:PorV/PorQ family protein n=1 Tax=Pseudochryseolinea flava TaxID=2059302 RepID=A0A364XXV4_9BACT|nr:hypothetical protein [Pseudochryseolinea flava]RAV98818.1 hypothetical protein DQQ10_22655 [Pseudochryseolinea flava]
MLKYIPVVYFVCTGIALFSQSANTLIGSRAQALGYSSACLYDEWSLFNNAAGVANIKHLAAGFTYEANPGFSYFNRAAFVTSIPIKFGAFGVGAQRFGDHLYNEHVVSTAFASTFGLASIGVKINYIQYHVEGSGNKSLFSFNFGGIAKLTDQLSVGAHIININQGKLTEDGIDRIPTILQVGIAFKAFTKLTVVTEVQKDLEYDALWKGGIEYQPFKKFLFRTGFNIHPDAAFAGFGARFQKMHLDYAATFLRRAGVSHQASIIYHFRAAKE